MPTVSEREEFLRESQYFAGFDTMSTPHDVVERMRGWLQKAPAFVPPQGMNIWGGVLHHLLATFASCACEPTTDAPLLGAYFDAMAKLAPDDWWAERDNGIRAYDAFKSVCGVVDGQHLGWNHLLMDTLLDQSWEPHAVLTALNNMRAQEMNNMGVDASDWDMYIGSSVQGVFLRCAWVRLDQGWVPPDTAMFGQLWLVAKANSSLASSARIEILRSAIPGQAPQMLTALLFNSSVSVDEIASFFPLRPAELHACDAHPLVHALVGLLTEGGQDDPTYKAKIVEVLLQRHHPEIASMMNLHLDLVPQACEACTYADMVVPAFEAWRGRAIGVQSMPVSADLFTDGPSVW